VRSLAALVALGVGVLFGVALLTSTGDAARPGMVAAKQLRGVNFVSNCGFSHRAPDDPIVHAGMPGMSHDHSFVGNNTTNAFSTRATLLRGTSTCRRAGDTAAYWMPTLSVNGQPVLPTGATIYYRRKSVDAIRPFPAGLKMIAGSALATAPQGEKITFWNCGQAAGIPPSSTVPTCPDTRMSALRLHVNFPSCWDGKNLDSADHQSHMAYPAKAHCPASHPVVVPAITLIYRYPTTGGSGVTLASGGQYSAHADFFNAWKQPQLKRLVNDCLVALRHCQRGN
jgi:Domain of unknown function (DUF1996)